MTTTLLPTDPQPIAVLATRDPAKIRDMTRTLSRMYGPGLIVTTTGARTTWAKPAPTRKTPRRPLAPTPGRTTR